MIIRLKTGIPDEYVEHMEPVAKKLIKTGYVFPEPLPGEDPEITGGKNKVRPGKKLLTAEVLKNAVLSQVDHEKITEQAQKILKDALNMDYFSAERAPILKKHLKFLSEFTSHKLEQDHNRIVNPQSIQTLASRYLAEKRNLPTIKDVIRMDDKIRQDRKEHEKIANWPKTREWGAKKR
jgi:hypothetical protein